ncbi:hypothetical protein BH11PLA2_BH11PLA2_18290 [soil metagenome]
MTPVLPSWLRPNFVPRGGDPFLLFAAFGPLNLSVPIDKTTYRAAGVPKGFELLLFDKDKHPGTYKTLRESPAWALAAAESPELADIAAESPQFAMLRGVATDPVNLDYLRDAVGIVEYLTTRGAKTVFDPQTYQFWQPNDWHDRLFAPAKPVPHEHVIILETPDDTDDTTWIHTRGLRKFGRPDLSVHGVGDKFRDRITDLFNHYVDYLARGGVIREGDVITLVGLPGGSRVRIDSRLDHPEFLNAHAEIIWPSNALTK